MGKIESHIVIGIDISLQNWFIHLSWLGGVEPAQIQSKANSPHNRGERKFLHQTSMHRSIYLLFAACDVNAVSLNGWKYLHVWVHSCIKNGFCSMHQIASPIYTNASNVGCSLYDARKFRHRRLCSLLCSRAHVRMRRIRKDKVLSSSFHYYYWERTMHCCLNNVVFVAQFHIYCNGFS